MTSDSDLVGNLARLHTLSRSKSFLLSWEVMGRRTVPFGNERCSRSRGVGDSVRPGHPGKVALSILRDGSDSQWESSQA